MGFFKDVDESSNEDLLAEIESIDSEDMADDSDVAEALSAFGDIEEDNNDADSDILSAIDSIDDAEIADIDSADAAVDVSAAVPETPVEPAVEATVEADIPSIPADDNSGVNDDKEVTVITKGTTIKGGISSDCSLEVMGVITGDVECQGKLSIFGSVSGNAIASEIFVNTPVKLVGDLNSTGCVKVSENSVVVGKIVAVSAYIAGAIKGDIEVLGPVVVDKSAVVVGNITAKTLQFNNGAVCEGICTVGTIPSDISAKFE